MRIIVGKKAEHTLLLRNNNQGPILQSIFYDFEGELQSLRNGKNISNSYAHNNYYN